MAARTEARRAALRQNLIDIAERRIADLGYPALTARDLAAEAGCALGAIYTSFPDMETMVAAVNSRTVARLEQAVAAAFAATESPEDPKTALVLLGQTYHRFVVENPRLWSAIFELGFGPGTEIPRARIEENTRLLGHVVKPVRTLFPDMSDERRMLIAKSLFSAVHGIVSLGLQRRFVAVPREEI